MNPDDYFKLGSYGSPSYGAAAPAFNNQLLSGFDYSGQAAIDSNKYISSNPMAGMGGVPIAPSHQSGLFASPFQQKNADGSSYGGWLGAGMGVAQGVGNMYMGMKQFGLAKEQLAFGKEQFNKNYAAQRTTTNTALEDRQAARVGANSSAYQSVSEYMNKNRIV